MYKIYYSRPNSGYMEVYYHSIRRCSLAVALKRLIDNDVRIYAVYKDEQLVNLHDIFSYKRS